MVTDEQKAELTRCQRKLEALMVAYDYKQRELVAALENARRLEAKALRAEWLLGILEEETRG